VPTEPMPKPLAAAKAWAASNIAGSGRRWACKSCSKLSTACLCCSSCDMAYCRPCLGLHEGELWSLGFQCPACIAEDARLDPEKPVDPGIEDLARSMLASLAASLKPSTWVLYQRCIADMLAFSRERNVQVFPVDSQAAVNGISLFFEYLRQCGFSWARISHYRAAIRKLCSMGKLPDPFNEYPQLRDLCEGLKKRITLRPRRKEGVTLHMVRALLDFWRRSEVTYRQAGNIRLADLALRNQVAVILGWCGMLRASEVFVGRDRTKGVLRSHLTYVHGSHIKVFIRSMKNDPYSMGNEILLAWVTASGIPIGETFLRYEARLRECNIPEDAPLILPTNGHRGFHVTAGGCRPDGCLKAGLKACFGEFRNVELLARFSWHSLRRGGASHAFREKTDKRLVMGHGLWKSEEGVRPYMVADLHGKLSVTQCM